MRKIAQDSVSIMSNYVNHLRVLYMVHQNNHWKISGDNFYGNHLLFQRLYESVQEMVDEAAEKCIGVYGDLKKADITSILDKYEVESTDDQDAYLKSSLEAEKDFQDIAKNVYNMLKESNAITLGVDDMIMSQASNSEVNMYLLQQAIIGN